MDTIVCTAHNRAHSTAIAAIARLLPESDKVRLRAELRAELLSLEATRNVDPRCTDFTQVLLAEYISVLSEPRVTRRPGKRPAVKLSVRQALRASVQR